MGGVPDPDWLDPELLERKIRIRQEQERLEQTIPLRQRYERDQASALHRRSTMTLKEVLEDYDMMSDYLSVMTYWERRA